MHSQLLQHLWRGQPMQQAFLCSVAIWSAALSGSWLALCDALPQLGAGLTVEQRVSHAHALQVLLRLALHRAVLWRCGSVQAAMLAFQRVARRWLC